MVDKNLRMFSANRHIIIPLPLLPFTLIVDCLSSFDRNLGLTVTKAPDYLISGLKVPPLILPHGTINCHKLGLYSWMAAGSHQPVPDYNHKIVQFPPSALSVSQGPWLGVKFPCQHKEKSEWRQWTLFVALDGNLVRVLIENYKWKGILNSSGEKQGNGLQTPCCGLCPQAVGFWDLQTETCLGVCCNILVRVLIPLDKESDPFQAYTVVKRESGRLTADMTTQQH